MIDAVDHRHGQSPVRNQGPRDACVGFAVSAAHEWMAPGSRARSPEDALWAAHQIGGRADVESTTIEFALRGLALHRHAEELAWPYGNPPWPAPRPAAASRQEAQLTPPQWREIGNPSFEAIDAELISGAAVLLSVRVVRSAWTTGAALVDAPPGRVARAGHAVLAVGTVRNAVSDRIIFKNSWGPDWGDEGYGLLTRQYLDAYLRRAFVVASP